MMGLHSQSGLLSQPYPALVFGSRRIKRSFVSSQHLRTANQNRTKRHIPIQSNTNLGTNHQTGSNRFLFSKNARLRASLPQKLIALLKMRVKSYLRTGWSQNSPCLSVMPSLCGSSLMFFGS